MLLNVWARSQKLEQVTGEAGEFGVVVEFPADHEFRSLVAPMKLEQDKGETTIHDERRSVQIGRKEER